LSEAGPLYRLESPASLLLNADLIRKSISVAFLTPFTPKTPNIKERVR